jgi:hypothetical protein
MRRRRHVRRAARIVPPRFPQFEVSRVFKLLPAPTMAAQNLGTRLQLIRKHAERVVDETTAGA